MFLGRMLNVVLFLTSFSSHTLSAPIPFPQRSEFSIALHRFAKQTAKQDAPRYFGIVRRVLDELEASAERVGIKRAASEIKLETFDGPATDLDRDANSQAITTLRLGIPYEAGERIVGGYPVTPATAFLEVVAITGNNALCSGTVIDKRTVLTAAHCVCNLKLNTTSGDSEIKKIFVTHKIGVVGAKEYLIDVSRTRFLASHLGAPDPCAIKANLRLGRPDIAVVRSTTDMTGPVMKIATQQLMDTSLGTPRNPAKSDMHIFGFGCTSPVFNPARQRYECKDSASDVKFGGIIYHSWTCSTPTCAPGFREFVLKDLAEGPITDTCSGDSGGPVVVFQQVARLIGVTSRSLSDDGRCGPGGIYGKTATTEVVVNWLKSSEINVDVQQ